VTFEKRSHRKNQALGQACLGSTRKTIKQKTVARRTEGARIQTQMTSPRRGGESKSQTRKEAAVECPIRSQTVKKSGISIGQQESSKAGQLLDIQSEKGLKFRTRSGEIGNWGKGVGVREASAIGK